MSFDHAGGRESADEKTPEKNVERRRPQDDAGVGPKRQIFGTVPAGPRRQGAAWQHRKGDGSQDNSDHGKSHEAVAPAHRLHQDRHDRDDQELACRGACRAYSRGETAPRLKTLGDRCGKDVRADRRESNRSNDAKAQHENKR